MVARSAHLRPALLPGGARLFEHPSLDMDLVRAMFAREDAFVSISQIVREDESSGYLDPTYTQRILLHAFHHHSWNYVDKYRQAKITTISVMLMLRDCMYLEGVKGLLVAESKDTAADVFERILFAYNKLPPEIKGPIAPGRRQGVSELHFAHGGNIKILTAGTQAPAIGRSPDRLVFTEFGLVRWQAEAASNIFPSMTKRKNARVIVETTPGKRGTHGHQMWKDALEGKSRFNPVFLRWWHDRTCESDPTGFTPTEAEQHLLDTVPKMTMRNLAFRREQLNTYFGGDERLCSNKYPNSPYDGWIGSAAPVMPMDALEHLMSKAVPDPPVGDHGVREIEPPIPGRPYLLVADPAGFGGSKNDPSAVTVFDAITLREVAFWEGRADPTRFASRLVDAQKRYCGGLLAVESNAAAVITILRDWGVSNLLYTDPNHPGWYATSQRILQGEARLVQMLRDRDITLRSKSLLHQLMNYDGNLKKRIRGLDGSLHHFDRARTAVMAADILSTRRFVEKSQARSRNVPEHVPGRVTIGELDRFARGAKRSLFRPASSYE